MGCVGSSAGGTGTDGKFHENYRLGKKLGEGAFGQVRVAKPRFGDQEMAVKIIDVRSRDFNGEPTKQADAERVSVTRGEIKVWQAVGTGEHIVSLTASFFERNLFYMVMEKCSCSLMDKLSKMSAVMEDDMCRIFSEMLAGLSHTHERRIAHRDIKPDNFLFGGASGNTVKLCDFGLAAQLPKKGKLRGVYGTAPYMSPEMLGNSGYDEKTDVWSFGSTAFLMIHGDFPYVPKEATAPAMKKCIIQGRPEIRFVKGPDEETFFSRSFVDRATPFLQALLQRVPATRKSADEAMQMDFLLPKTSEHKNVFSHDDNQEAPLAPAFRKARKATATQMDFKPELQKRQPILQNNLEDLLQLLQEKYGQSGAGTTFFSEGDENIEASKTTREMNENKTEDRIHKRSETRFGTHSGVTGKKSGNIDVEKLRNLDLTTLYDAPGDSPQASKGAKSLPAIRPLSPEGQAR